MSSFHISNKFSMLTSSSIFPPCIARSVFSLVCTTTLVSSKKLQRRCLNRHRAYHFHPTWRRTVRRRQVDHLRRRPRRAVVEHRRARRRNHATSFAGGRHPRSSDAAPPACKRSHGSRQPDPGSPGLRRMIQPEHAAELVDSHPSLGSEQDQRRASTGHHRCRLHHRLGLRVGKSQRRSAQQIVKPSSASLIRGGYRFAFAAAFESHAGPSSL